MEPGAKVNITVHGEPQQRACISIVDESVTVNQQSQITQIGVFDQLNELNQLGKRINLRKNSFFRLPEKNTILSFLGYKVLIIKIISNRTGMVAFSKTPIDRQVATTTNTRLCVRFPRCWARLPDRQGCSQS